MAHALLVDPARQTLLEAMQRRADGAWLARTYTPVDQGTIDHMYKINSEALTDATRSPFSDLAEPNGHALLLRLLDALRQRAAAK